MGVEQLIERVKYEFKERGLKPCRTDLVQYDDKGNPCAVGSIIGDSTICSYDVWVGAHGIKISGYVLGQFILGWMAVV